MLTPEENDRLCSVGPGTPGGELFRRYWLPAALSTELPEPDGVPLRVRLLGEDLIAFRDSNGRVGLVDAYCPHRRAPLFFGRNEECGLRCVYHGWKFDVEGQCVDLPSEPAGSPMKGNIRLLAYPTVERGGVVWAYLGPKDKMPAPPDYEWSRAPATHRHVSKTYEQCNYLQALEGGLDTAHSSFVHNNNIGNKDELRNRDKAPRLEVEPTDYGYCYVSLRKRSDEENYVRVYQYVMPTHQLRSSTVDLSGGRSNVPKIDGHIWVPIDDESTYVYNIMYGYDDNSSLSAEYIESFESFSGRGKSDFIPGTWRLKQNLSNDYLVDRTVQKTKTYTGIKGLNTQDFALQEGMGVRVDRSKEHLGTTDRAIAMMRRLMLEAVDQVLAGGMPRGSDPATYRDVRPHDKIVPRAQPWRTAVGPELMAKW